MAKDSKGHGSERKAVGYATHYGRVEQVQISPSKASVAKGRGWDKAVSMKLPGQVPIVYENMDRAKAKLEKHPGFVGWGKK